MMTDHELIQSTLRRLSRRLRLVRAVTAGSRFLVAGLALALVPLFLKGLLPGDIRWATVGLIAGMTTAGLLYGSLLRARPAHVARLADRRLGFKERLTCAVEHLSGEDPDAIIRAQHAETAARVRALRAREAFPISLTAEFRIAGPLAALALALALLPAIPLHLPGRSDAPTPPAAEVADESRERPLEQKLTTPTLPKDMFPKVAEQEVQRGPLSSHNQAGDQAAVFRDTKMSQQQPDFGSFVKQGDERLKMLARPDAIPDLRRDFTQSPYQVMIRRMQQQLKAGSLQGLSWEQIERLLSELGQTEQRMGGSGLADELMQEMEGQAGGSTDKMMSALSRALSRLRDRDESARGKGKGLRDAPSRQRGAGDGQGEGDGARDDGAPGGSLPGTEKSLLTQGDATPRIGGDKQDSTLDGDPREGQMEAYDTNLSGLGAQTPSRLPYLDVFAQYRKMMEETLTKEPIPFSYREQVKEYFRALEPR
jgi:hypothetical protein